MTESKIACECSTCDDGRTCESFITEVKTSDHRGLAHRRNHRGPMAIDKFVNAATKIRESEFWTRDPKYMIGCVYRGSVLRVGCERPELFRDRGPYTAVHGEFEAK